MPVDISVKGEVITARLVGEIDHHTAVGIRTEIDNAIETYDPSLMIMDFERVTFMDSSGIGLVMGRYKTISKNGGSIHVCGTNPYIYKVMRLSGLERIVKLEGK